MKDRLAREMVERDMVLEVRNAELQGLLVAAWLSGAKEEAKKQVIEDAREALIDGHTHAIFTTDHLKKQVRSMLNANRKALHKEKAMRTIDEASTRDAVRFYFDGLTHEDVEGSSTPLEALEEAQASIKEALAMLGDDSG